MPHKNQQLSEFVFEFSTSVNANSNTTVERTPEEGVVTQGVIVGWPDGANNVVGVQVRTGSGDKLFPRNREDDFIAANDAWDHFPMRKKIKKNEPIEVEYQNDDPNNGHFVNVIVPLVLDLDDGEQPNPSDRIPPVLNGDGA